MWWGIAFGGALGALARFGLSTWIASRSPFGSVPIATLVVNVLGSFALGLLWALAARGAVSDAWKAWLGVGFLGAFTTFSTFSAELDVLFRRGAWTSALVYGASSVLLGFAAVVLGRVLGDR